MSRETRQRHKALTDDGFLGEEDTDYVSTFDRLAAVEARIERRGPSTDRLLQRSVLYHALGDHKRSARDASRVVWEDASNLEAHYRLAVAHLARAAQLMGLLPTGLGAADTRCEDPHELLVAAETRLRYVRSMNPRDEEAVHALAAARRLLRRRARTDKAGRGT